MQPLKHKLNSEIFALVLPLNAMLYRLMTHKLFALASGKCCPESSDSPSNQEILLGGHLYLMAIKVCRVMVASVDPCVPSGSYQLIFIHVQTIIPSNKARRYAQWHTLYISYSG